MGRANARPFLLSVDHDCTRIEYRPWIGFGGQVNLDRILDRISNRQSVLYASADKYVARLAGYFREPDIFRVSFAINLYDGISVAFRPPAFQLWDQVETKLLSSFDLG